MQRESIPVPVPPPGTPTTGSALLQTAQEMRGRAEAMLALAENATPGPWRKKRESLDADHPELPATRWQIVAGFEKRRRNMGHFHPEDATYTEDEVNVVGFGYDRDYGDAEGGIEKEADADLIAACDPGTVSRLARDVVALTDSVAGLSADVTRLEGMEAELRSALERIAENAECSIGLAGLSKHETFCALHVARGALALDGFTVDDGLEV